MRRSVLVVVLVVLLAFGVSAEASNGPPPAVHPVLGTVYDPLLEVTWLADADLPRTQTFGVKGINRNGSMDYATALLWIRALNAHRYLGHGDWLLPTTPTPSHDPSCSSKNHKFGFGCLTSAFGSLYTRTLHLQAPDTAVPIPAGKVGPFRDFQPYLYWTDRPGRGNTGGFSTFSFNTGWSGSNTYSHTMYVLPLLQGNPFHTPGTGQGLHPSRDGATVWDPAAGVTWLADADLARTEQFGVRGIDRDGSMEEPTAAEWLQAMNRRGWLGRKDWQFPENGGCGGFGCGAKAGPMGELYYDELHLAQGTPDSRVGAFDDVQPYLYWSCAAASIQGPCRGQPVPDQEWSFSFGNGFQGTDILPNDLVRHRVLPVELLTSAR
jgi:hypothetical protein